MTREGSTDTQVFFYAEALGYLKEAVHLAPHDLEIRIHFQKAEQAL